MSAAQPQYLPEILGRIYLAPPATVTFKGITKRNLGEALKDETLFAIADYCERKYLSAPYVMGAQLNDELAEAVQMKYLRSLPDWEPTEELPALKPTITSHKLIMHWAARVAKTTHIDLCRAHATYRKHYILASDLIPAGAEGFDSLEWAQGLQYGGVESSVDTVKQSSECEIGSGKLASFYKIKSKDWYRIRPRSDDNHPLPESCRARSYVVPIKGKQDVVLEPLNNPLQASSASKPYSQGQKYQVWPAEALAIVGQALSKLSVEERTLIRKGWDTAEYDSDFEKLLKRLDKLSTPNVSEGRNWPYKSFRKIVNDAGGLMGLWDEYAGWNVNPFLLSELSYSPSHAIPVVEVSEPVSNSGFNLFFPSAGNETPSSTHHRYQGADVEILEDGTGDLRLVRYICDERAPVWVPVEDIIAPKKKVSKRAHQVANMYRCSERECSCKPVHKYLKDKLACRDNDCRCRPANPPYTGPLAKNERENWLVSVGQPADWERPEYLRGRQ